MKLLQATTIPGTLEAFLLPFAFHFRGLGWQVDAAAAGIHDNEACVATFDTVFDIPWSRNPLSPSNLAAYGSVRELVTRERYDLVHVHTPVASFVTRFALRRPLDPPVVYTAHGFHFYEGGHPVKNTLYRSLEQLAGKWTDLLTVMNEEDLRAATRYKIVSPERVEYVPGIGVDIAAMKTAAHTGSARDELRASLEVPATAPVFLMVAEFIPRKRHEDALRAFVKVKSDPPAHLLLAGIGPEMSRLRELARILELGKRVHFLGYRRDVPSLIAASDALILVSEQEGLPRSIMEAMAVGTPVIGTDIRGVSDLLADGAGRLVPVGNRSEISRAMQELANSPELRASIAVAAGKRVTRYDISNVLSAYERIYTTALGQ